MKKNVYCPTCNAVIELSFGERQETRDYHGEQITFLAKYAECPVCHQEFLRPETHDVNLAYLQDEYRRRHHLLSPDEIRKIRQSYGLSARSFARILGMGDVSITRYENGAIPDEALHNLMLLSEQSRNFSVLFERNKDRLSQEEQRRVKDIISKSTVKVVVWERWLDSTAKVEDVEYNVKNDCLECISA